MAAAVRKLRISPETEYLREFAQAYLSEVSWSPKAEAQMLRVGVDLTDVHYVMRTGDVTESEKEDAEGARWVVEGETCEEERLRLSLEVDCNRYKVCIVDVRKPG